MALFKGYERVGFPAQKLEIIFFPVCELKKPMTNCEKIEIIWSQPI